MPAARYEILLPLKYNDGRDVEPEKLLSTKEELIRRFGGLTVDPYPAEGVWNRQGASGRDVLLRHVVEVEEDTAEVRMFFESFKRTLRARFAQLEIRIVAVPIRVV